jgi:transposase
MARTPTPKPKPKSTPKGDAAVKEYKKQISPEGVAAAEAAARAALEKKYPGMFIPKKRTNTLIPGR